MTGSRVRLASLDTFRGMAVAAMILVNNPGNWAAVYPPLTHAALHGCTFADLIFPAFIVIMGMALPWTLDRRRAGGAGGRRLLRKVLMRASILFAIGLGLNAVIAWPHLELLRIPGVLQRIAITYALTALIVARLGIRAQLSAAAVLLLSHWAALVWLPHWTSIDHAVFGAHALTAGGDPEGLVGLGPSVATALLGVAAGRWTAAVSTPRARIAGLIAGGAAAVAAGWTWSLVLPFSKPLWTGSFALFATGLALLAFALCHALIDGRDTPPWWSRPFAWLGLNPLAIYALSELTAHLLERPWLPRGATVMALKDVLYWRWLVPFVGDAGSVRSSLIYALGYASLWLLVAALLQRRGIALRA